MNFTDSHYLYIFATNTDFFKIGISKEPLRRLKTINTSTPEPVKMLFVVKCPSKTNARIFETRLHEILKKSRSNGEWFHATKKDLAISFFEFMMEIGDCCYISNPPLKPEHIYDGDGNVTIPSWELKQLQKHMKNQLGESLYGLKDSFSGN